MRREVEVEMCGVVKMGAFQIIGWQHSMLIDGVTSSHPVDIPQRQFEMYPLKIQFVV